MARVNHGPIVMDATGKAGPVVFAHYFGTPYVRQKQKPYYSNSPQQQAERELFASVARQWAHAKYFLNQPMRPRAYELGKFPHTYWNSACLRALKSGATQTIFPQNFGLPTLPNLRLEVDGAFVQLRSAPTFIDLSVFLFAYSIDTFGNARNIGQLGLDGNPIDITICALVGELIPPILTTVFLGITDPPFDLAGNWLQQSAGQCAILP